MCGIAGILAVRGTYGHRLAGTATTMADRLMHRGPDASGCWTDDQHVALAHRRLSIIDISEAGSQPMESADGRWVLTYNGELYNTAQLRSQLGEARRLRGHSDTEVLVETIARFGVDHALRSSIGMFAFAAWDRRDKQLVLARDRFGEKPLYLMKSEGDVYFASELSALEAVMRTRHEFDRRAVLALLERGAIPAPLTIYQDVEQLLPGHVVRMGLDGVPSCSRYWDPVELVANRQLSPSRGEDAVDELEDLLTSTVRSRMVSDVPLGAFLSGGIDSATIVALMSEAGGTVRTFTVGFEDEELNEADIARRIAEHFGTEHRQLIATGADALSVVPKLASLYDQPFADSSQIPTYLVSEFTQQHVTVALSGDAGDELFGGYSRYQYLERLQRLHDLPRPIRRTAATALGVVPERLWDDLNRSTLSKHLPAALRRRTAGKVTKLRHMLAADSLVELYDELVKSNHEVSRLLKGRPRKYEVVLPNVPGLGATEVGMLADTVGYLPNDILTKVDRAAMSVSLETRVPFLDPAVFGFAWSLHPSERSRDGRGKHVLREVLARRLPSEVVDLPKRGFGVPLDAWLRGPLRQWADELLDPGLVEEFGILDGAHVQRRWKSHLQHHSDRGHELWPILMLQAWTCSRKGRAR